MEFMHAGKEFFWMANGTLSGAMDLGIA